VRLNGKRRRRRRLWTGAEKQPLCPEKYIQYLFG